MVVVAGDRMGGWDWLKPKKHEHEKAGNPNSPHPFDRAAQEINDALAEYKLTTEGEEEKANRKEIMEMMRRMKS